jgi:DNA-binding MarR family transcriptional regulator
MKRRSSPERCMCVLQTVYKYPGASKSRIISYCGLNQSIKEPIVKLLVNRGLLRVEKKPKGERGWTLKVTPKGNEWLLKAQDVLTAITIDKM